MVPLRNRSLLIALLVASVWMPAPTAADALTECLDLCLVGAPAAFSPNGDAVDDVADLAARVVPSTGTLNVRILDLATRTSLRTLVQDLTVAPGDLPLSWDGRDDSGVLLPDAGYVVSATLTWPEGAATAETTVRIDTRAPRLRWRAIAPEPVTDNDPVRFRFRVGDAAPQVRVTAVVSDSQGVIAKQDDDVRTGDAQVAWRPRYDNGSPLLPGLYGVRLVAVDDAGNRTESSERAFRDHRPVDSRVFHRLGGTGPRVALTFDDCNDGAAWGRILRILDDRNVQASFFCLGPNVGRFRAQARRTVADGHTVGSHSMNHALETQLSYAEIVRQNRAPQGIWWKVARTTPAPYFRPPYGGYDSEVLRAVGADGYARTIIWDVDPRDWEHPGSAAIADRVVSSSHAGSIVVMHTLDGTAAALPSIIARLRSKGLEPVSLEELFHATGMREPVDAGPVLADPFE